MTTVNDAIIFQPPCIDKQSFFLPSLLQIVSCYGNCNVIESEMLNCSGKMKYHHICWLWKTRLVKFFSRPTIQLQNFANQKLQSSYALSIIFTVPAKHHLGNISVSVIYIHVANWRHSAYKKGKFFDKGHHHSSTVFIYRQIAKDQVLASCKVLIMLCKCVTLTTTWLQKKKKKTESDLLSGKCTRSTLLLNFQ